MESKDMEHSMLKNLQEKTGKSLEEWVSIVRTTRLSKHKEIIEYLKSEHGFTYGFANLVAHKARGSDAGSVENVQDLIDAQYSGAKAHLRPVYDAVIAMIKTFGEDVEIAPKKSYVSLRRKKQFALIQPSTKDRVDVGINNKEANTTPRLELSGSFNQMVSHRVRISAISDVDDELKSWLHQAYLSS